MSKIYVTDCSTGESVLRDMTPQEEAQLTADRAEDAKREQAQKAAKTQRDADHAAIREKARTDPTFAALDRLLGD